MANGTNENLAADAAAYIAGSGDFVPLSRGDASELRKQSGKLCEWARRAERLIDYTPPADSPRSKGAEHEVFFHPKENRVFKRTYPGKFGSVLTNRGVRNTATPYFYLRRLELVNQVFGSGLRFEGVTIGDSPSILISQPWVHPADPKYPLPSLGEISDFLRRLGFEPVAETTPFEWFRKMDSVRVSDARPDNFIKTKEGAVPIDLIVSRG